MFMCSVQHYILGDLNYVKRPGKQSDISHIDKELSLYIFKTAAVRFVDLLYGSKDCIIKVLEKKIMTSNR